MASLRILNYTKEIVTIKMSVESSAKHKFLNSITDDKKLFSTNYTHSISQVTMKEAVANKQVLKSCR
jgi:hypothetical protein